MTLNCLYSGVELANIISVCIVRLLYPLEFSSQFLPGRKNLVPSKNPFLAMEREEIPFFLEEIQPWYTLSPYITTAFCLSSRFSLLYANIEMAEDPSKESLVTDISNGISYLASLDEALHAIMTVITYLQGHLPGSVDHIKTLFSVKCYLADYEGKTERNVNIAPDSLSARIRDDSCENNPDEISSEETVDLLVGDNSDDIMQHVADHEIWDGSQDENRALNTLPSCLSVRTSRVKPAGVGVFTNVCLTESVYFGPYEGETVENPDSCITTRFV